MLRFALRAAQETLPFPPGALQFQKSVPETPFFAAR